jgi:mono/diheme cytochrome c family protein
MKPHARHMTFAIVIALILLVLATVAARSQDYSGYSGAELYDRFCSACHGTSGRGDGPVAAALRIETPDLTRLSQRHGGQFPQERVRQIIDGSQLIGAHGTRTMPVWGFEFLVNNATQPAPTGSADEMIGRLTDHIRSLQRETP